MLQRTVVCGESGSVPFILIWHHSSYSLIKFLLGAAHCLRCHRRGGSNTPQRSLILQWQTKPISTIVRSISAILRNVAIQPMPFLGVLCCIYLGSGGVAHFKEAGVVEQIGGNGLWRLLEYQAKLILGSRFVVVH